MKPEPLTTKRRVVSEYFSDTQWAGKSRTGFRILPERIGRILMNDFKETEIPEDDHPIY